MLVLPLLGRVMRLSRGAHPGLPMRRKWALALLQQVAPQAVHLPRAQSTTLCHAAKEGDASLRRQAGTMQPASIGGAASRHVEAETCRVAFNYSCTSSSAQDLAMFRLACTDACGTAGTGSACVTSVQISRWRCFQVLRRNPLTILRALVGGLATSTPCCAVPIDDGQAPLQEGLACGPAPG